MKRTALANHAVPCAIAAPAVMPPSAFNAAARADAAPESCRLPDDQSETGVDVEVADRVQSELRKFIERSASSPENPTEARIGAPYSSFMDEARVEKLADAPVRRELDLIKAVATHAQFARLMGGSYSSFSASFFSLRVAPDERKPVNTLILGQGGLGMPDRNYYLDTSLHKDRAAYQSYVARALSMVGWPRPDADAQAVLALETQIARVSWTQAQKPGPERDIQPYLGGRTSVLCTRRRLAELFRGRWRGQHPSSRRGGKQRRARVVTDICRNPPRYVEGLEHVSYGRCGIRVPVESFRRESVPIPRHSTFGCSDHTSPLEARRSARRRKSRPSAGSGVRRALLRAAYEGAGDRAGRALKARPAHRHHRLDLDEPADTARGLEQADPHEGTRRIS